MREIKKGHFMAELMTDKPVEKQIIDSGGQLDDIQEDDFVIINLPKVIDEEYPQYKDEKELNDSKLGELLNKVEQIMEELADDHVIGVISETPLVPYLNYSIFRSHDMERTFSLRLKETTEFSDALDMEYVTLSFFSTPDKEFKFNKLRTSYRYCPECKRTTKDYGGKKHLYDEFGTMQRDVWKHPDIEIDLDDPAPKNLIERLWYMFSRNEYQRFNFVTPDFMRLLDTTSVDMGVDFPEVNASNSSEEDQLNPGENRIINRDCLDILPKIPDNSVDLEFLDPPYNIGKEYSTYDDNREAEEYFNWCDNWLSHCIRVLKEGGVLVGLNIPEASYRWFMTLTQELKLQNVICWDSMSKPPAGNIMPTNYPILVFSKDDLATFNYDSLDSIGEKLDFEDSFEDKFIYPLDDLYCKRKSCRNKRRSRTAKKELTDLWTDVYRLKHKSKREDHPTMLPPKMMRRILGLFTNENDIVLDPFNGVGTTTLTADQLNRRFTGIEISEDYASIARNKHQQIDADKDPFDKDVKSISSPPSNKKDYEVPKKDLQLEIKKIANDLGHVPSKEEVKEHSDYSINYYEDYFNGWSEVTKAVNTTGMTEFSFSS